MFKMRNNKLVYFENEEIVFTYDTLKHTFEFPAKPNVSIYHVVAGENESLATYLNNVKTMADRLLNE